MISVSTPGQTQFPELLRTLNPRGILVETLDETNTGAMIGTYGVVSVIATEQNAVKASVVRSREKQEGKADFFMNSEVR